MTAALRDASDRKSAEQALRQAEDQLRQAQKMEAVGALAAGVAHDFNNILSVMLSYAGLVLERLEPGDPAHADVEEIRKAGERAVHLTRHLLAVGRRHAVAPRVVSLNAIASGIERMLRLIMGDKVELAFVPAHALGMVHADQGQMEQVLMNLVINARDAMPAGGRITIETANWRSTGRTRRGTPSRQARTW